MTRIMFPMVLFQTLLGLIAGMLQTGGNFTVPPVVSLAFNVVIISVILGLGPVFGIQAVGVATVLAVAVQVVLQVPALWRLGYRWHPILDLREPGLRPIGALVIRVLVGTAVGFKFYMPSKWTLLEMLAFGLNLTTMNSLPCTCRLYWEALYPEILAKKDLGKRKGDVPGTERTGYSWPLSTHRGGCNTL